MELVAATPTTATTNGSPFHNHDVREWSRLDSITGVLERARLETDQWTSNTANSTHKYNKVVDSRARSGADGNHQQQARRKLEVFQSQVPGGRIQVIKTQTVSSSRWTGLGGGGGRRIINNNNNNNSSSIEDNNEEDEAHFEDLQLSLNPLDLTSEKSKASVGRSVGRRPPSRSRIRDDILGRDLRTTAATNLHRVSRLCHQIHDDAVRKTFGKYQSPLQQQQQQKQQKQTLSIDERQSGDGVEIVEVESETHSKLSRTKSTSSEDLHDPKNLEDLDEQLQSWRRTSKIRRSLQYPKQKATNSKPPDLPSNTGSVRRIKEDLETGKRLNTALRGNSVDLDALDQILRSISNSSVSSGEQRDDKDDPKQQQKRNSFVTVESIRAVRGRLRRTSSPTKDIYRPEEIDDGIVTERQNDMNERVKSYVFGMDGDMQKKIVVTGTGSLESRPKPSSVSVNRNEDWFSRRKSYGFEQMHNQPETMSSKTKSRVESSTDSGICRSTEIVLVPTPTKANVVGYVSESEEELKQAFGDDPGVGNVKKYASLFESKKEANYWSKKPEAVTITIPITTTEGGGWRENGGETKRHSIAVDESKYMSKVTDNSFKRTSLAINDQRFDEDEGQGKSKHNKKVEFCKTEVHFAADSGKVNIVETDEKPPPTQNFRRRRRSNLQGDLPVLHFGDTGLEKSMFGDGDEAIYENIGDGSNNKEVVACGNVTVNAVNGYQDVGLEEQKENEAPRGILKNKPVKPKPYILGGDPLLLLSTDGGGGGSSGGDSEKTWGVKLKPAQKEENSPIWRSTVTVRNTFYDKEEPQPEFQKLLKQLRPTKEVEEESASEGIRILSPAVDSRRSSWSVADRIKQVEDLKWTENKGYSTKVNFGEGEATVVENRHPTWPRKDEYNKDLKKNLLNKGLVVRIGRNDTNSKHTVCSKTTTNSDTNGTTTTTKITIDLTPSPTNDNDRVSGRESFRFPRASLQSFKSPALVRSALGETLDLVQKRVKVAPQLDALRKLYDDDDDEVHSDSEADEEVHRILMNGSSERRLKDDLLHHNHDDDGSSVVSGSWSKMRAFKHINHYQKSITNGSHALLEKDASRLKEETTTESKFRYIDKQIENAISLNQEMEESNAKPEKLSSPYVVSRSKTKSSPDHSNCSSLERGTKHVLRQPKQSEMAYFGIKVNKPDLLQFGSNHRKQTKKLVDSPIYENVEQKNRRNKFDSSILEELTKAADQILQAVNGYTDEEQHQHHGKYSSDEERKAPKLDTISETKSWKRSGAQPTKKAVVSKAPKNKRESSNSSIENVPRECRKLSSTLESGSRKPFMTKSAEQKQRKKVVSGGGGGGGGGSGTDTAKAATKARRLQRASSREALLQSHGSSSEDLANPAESQVVRKPRMIKKTKSSQFTVSNGLDLKKPKRREDATKSRPSEERLSVGLPEIRHKTAVSTIRSTAEKAASREAKAKLRSEEVSKKRQTVKGGVGTTSSSSRSADVMSRGVLRTTTMMTGGRDQSHRNPSASNSSKVRKSSRNESTAATTKH
ncbi:PREDICTED: uncharacterized protein LOC108561772 isoform X2 [Nicrophorus vespilloides]|uniref:Uncharacterized protein LOC108561772 isoform X2 n=1 Tax=Nicrophorus vespilloides TaxID=110193 RepID=A0ABM1ML66_NICVS|nr:PREDICTED: uncharacterized protein LOC108561772 isoform X2 [Nicrophorus vespilloides]